MEVIFIIVAILCLLFGGMRTRQNYIKKKRNEVALQHEAAVSRIDEPQEETDVSFRMQGERGAGGPIYGDVLCSDGVYLPQVWESDFHTSFDGRWIRTGSYGESKPRLVDRKSQRCWVLSIAEASKIDDLHWRLPRWNGEAKVGNGVAGDAQAVMSDADFDTWLRKNVGQAAQALVGICDLWIPADCIPESAQSAPPDIAQPEGAAIHLSAQRYWPASLRKLPNPMEPLQTPYWQLMLEGELHSWIIDGMTSVVWRADGKAFACYGHPVVEGMRGVQRRLGVWSLEQGGLQWVTWQPEDRKAWRVHIDDTLGEQAKKGPPILFWDGPVLLQRVRVDTPQLERLHDGRHISCMSESVDNEVRHKPNGRPVIQAIAPLYFYWRRDLTQPTQWKAQSQPVAGHALVWTLSQEAKEEPGATAAYTLSWGGSSIPGLWELEHLVVQGRWAILCPWGTPAVQGGSPSPWIWDGEHLHAIDMPWPLVRLRGISGDNKVSMIVVAGRGPDNDTYASTGLWRWPIQPATATNAFNDGWSSAYEIRNIAPDASGRWHVLPRWREVASIQHPCADGDYVWHRPTGSDSLWWWGGLPLKISNAWDVNEPRGEGVVVTQSGAVLCATGPSACPHPGGDGWAILECLARTTDEPHYWKLHWLRSAKREVRTLELRAYLPVLQEWDALQGLSWVDEGATLKEGGLAKQKLIADVRWEEAQLDILKLSPGGLWLRKQDAVYAESIALRDDWPWAREIRK